MECLFETVSQTRKFKIKQNLSRFKRFNVHIELFFYSGDVIIMVRTNIRHSLSGK